MSKKFERKPIYRTVSDRGGQFIVNIANVPDGKVELYKLSAKGQSVPIADLELPPEIGTNSSPAEFREHIKKEIRRIETYVKAKNEFDKSKIALKIDETAAIEEGLIEIQEDKRRLPKGEFEESNDKDKKKGEKKKEKPRRGRPSFFKGVQFD